MIIIIIKFLNDHNHHHVTWTGFLNPNFFTHTHTHTQQTSKVKNVQFFTFNHVLFASLSSSPGLQQLNVPHFALFAESIVRLDPLDEAADARITLLDGARIRAPWHSDHKDHWSWSSCKDHWSRSCKDHWSKDVFKNPVNRYLTSRGPLRKSLQVSISFFPTIQDSQVYDMIIKIYGYDNG